MLKTRFLTLKSVILGGRSGQIGRSGIHLGPLFHDLRGCPSWVTLTGSHHHYPRLRTPGMSPCDTTMVLRHGMVGTCKSLKNTVFSLIFTLF